MTFISAVLIWILSGATFLIKNTTGTLRTIALAIPNSYGLNEIRGAVFSMDPSVGGVVSLDTGWLVMFGYLVLAVTVFLPIQKEISQNDYLEEWAQCHHPNWKYK